MFLLSFGKLSSCSDKCCAQQHFLKQSSWSRYFVGFKPNLTMYSSVDISRQNFINRFPYVARLCETVCFNGNIWLHLHLCLCVTVNNLYFLNAFSKGINWRFRCYMMENIFFSYVGCHAKNTTGYYFFLGCVLFTFLWYSSILFKPSYLNNSIAN